MLRNKLHPLVAVFAAMFVFPDAAHAHSTIESWGKFPNGLIHPLVTPSHLIIMLGLGLVMAQQRLSSLKSPMTAVVLGGALSLAMTINGSFPGVYSPILIGIALTLGILIALGKPVKPRVLNAVLAAGAAAIGFDSGVETGSLWQKTQALFGTLICIAIIVFDLAHYLSKADKKWQRIGVQVAGSWMIAVSFMMLAFAFRNNLR